MSMVKSSKVVFICSFVERQENMELKYVKKNKIFCSRWNWIHPPYWLILATPLPAAQRDERQRERKKRGAFSLCCSNWHEGGGGANPNNNKYVQTVYLCKVLIDERCCTLYYDTQVYVQRKKYRSTVYYVMLAPLFQP